MTDAWDETNPAHKKIAHGIEVGCHMLAAYSRLVTVSPRCGP
jgi:hypothetical protein